MVLSLVVWEKLVLSFGAHQNSSGGRLRASLAILRVDPSQNTTKPEYAHKGIAIEHNYEVVLEGQNYSENKDGNSPNPII